jgi:hypothetical protein
MPSHFVAFVLMGLAQIGTTVYGCLLSVKSLPSGVKRLPHLIGFIALGVCGCILTFWIGAQTYESERQTAESQNELMGKLEYQKGQLTTIAGMLKVNSNDPAVLASALAKALHPPDKLPCLNPVPFTATQRHGQATYGYETVVRVSNPNGIHSGTTFQLFFTDNVTSIKSLEVNSGASISGGDMGSFTVGSDVPKGQPFTILAEASSIPAEVRCIEKYAPPPQR